MNTATQQHYVFQSMRDTRQNLCGKRPAPWSWLYVDQADCCAERYQIYQRIVIVKEAALTSAICHFKMEGGCWALLSQDPAGRSWSSSSCCGQREPWQRTRLLQEILLWEGVCGPEGLFLHIIRKTWTLKKLSFFIIILETFLWASREVDVPLHVPANRCMEEPFEGLPEGFQGKPQRWRAGLRRTFCDWTWTAGMR